LVDWGFVVLVLLLCGTYVGILSGHDEPSLQALSSVLALLAGVVIAGASYYFPVPHDHGGMTSPGEGEGGPRRGGTTPGGPFTDRRRGRAAALAAALAVLALCTGIAAERRGWSHLSSRRVP
jgi:hypothetical protein